MHDFHGTFRDLLHAANLRHGTDGFTSPPKEGVLRIFSPLKIRRLRPFEPANLGTKGQHATPRPPKPYTDVITFHYLRMLQEREKESNPKILQISLKKHILFPKFHTMLHITIFFSAKNNIYSCLLCCPCHQIFVTMNIDTWKFSSFE